MGAAVVAARNENRPRAGDPGERQAGFAQAADARRVALGADDDEVVEHDVAAGEAVPGGDEGALGGPVVGQKNINIARPGRA